MSETPRAIQAFAAVMADISAVGKDGLYDAGKTRYNFRGVDGVVNAVGPVLRKHGVVIVPTVLDAKYREVETGANRTLMRESTVHVRYTVYGPAGDSFCGEVFGEALDSSDKGTAKATSVAFRIFLLQALTIPTMEPDPDESRHERSPRVVEDLPISAANADALRTSCEQKGVSVSETVLRATDGRTADPAEVLRSEVPLVKTARDELAATLAKQAAIGVPS
jgi:hypothetical protein